MELKTFDTFDRCLTENMSEKRGETCDKGPGGRSRTYDSSVKNYDLQIWGAQSTTTLSDTPNTEGFFKHMRDSFL